MKKLITYQIDSFTTEKFRGNPAGVILNPDGLSDIEMQRIARELNNSETALIFSADSHDCDGIIRYFTPTTEVPICGHATIAAMYAKASEENLDSCILRMKTHVGILPLEIIKTKENYEIVMTQGRFELSAPLDTESVQKMLAALGLEHSEMNHHCPIQIASTGHSKVMIAINNREKLNDLSPKFAELAALSKQIHCNGYFVFTFDSDQNDILTYGRMFAPAIGINEDPVTGNAHGPLGGYLVQNKIIRHDGKSFEFKGVQGEKMDRKGVITVLVKIENDLPARIQIKGNAVTLFKTEIQL